jgi:hypothetical protein
MSGSKARLPLAIAWLLALVGACGSSTTIEDDAPAGTGGTPSTSSETGGTSSTASETGGTSSGGETNEPPYANVTAVAVSGDSGAYTFNVSVESADIDCSQYADWWEVLSTDGVLVYRRILDHSHTDANGTSDADAPGTRSPEAVAPCPSRRATP